MEQYHLYHRKSLNDLNSYLDYAGYVEADSVEHAYTLSQNLDNPWNENEPCRSTSVGDIIINGTTRHIVADLGFRKLDFTKIMQDISKHKKDDR